MSKVKLAIVLAVLIHVLAFVLMLRKVSPVYENFYSFAWWTYIVAIAGVNHLRARNSLIFDRPREALWVFLLSTPVWLFFEIYNFRLDNWNYLGVPSNIYVRWPAYFIAFGTVLPWDFRNRDARPEPGPSSGVGEADEDFEGSAGPLCGSRSPDDGGRRPAP